MRILSFDLEEFTLYPKQRLGEVRPLYELLDRVLDLLDQKSIKATFFCLGEIARECPEVIRNIDSRGHSIGCHSDRHVWLTEFSPDELYKDTRIAVDSLEQILGRKVVTYRAPAFSIGEKNKWAIEVLAKCGIEIDCSIFPAARDFGGFKTFTNDSPTQLKYNGIMMKELPMSITSLLGKRIAYSGGGFFRLLPYSFIEKTMLSNDYVMTYFHLRDFDTLQYKRLTPRYFKSYYGIKGAFAKFERLVSTFDFIDVFEANDSIEWNNCKTIDL